MNNIQFAKESKEVEKVTYELNLKISLSELQFSVMTDPFGEVKGSYIYEKRRVARMGKIRRFIYKIFKR